MESENIIEQWRSSEDVKRDLLKITRIVKQRNKSLENIIWLLYELRYWRLIRSEIIAYAPQRGKKTEIPVEFVMSLLGVSHRTAQDYIRTVVALDKLFNLKILEQLRELER